MSPFYNLNDNELTDVLFSITLDSHNPYKHAHSLLLNLFTIVYKCIGKGMGGMRDMIFP